MNVYAVVVTYNGSKWIDKCFGSLRGSTIPLKVIAIDNQSTDGTPDLIRSRFPEVHLIEAGKNLGFGKANNLGLKIAFENNADYVFLLNQDAYIFENTIETLIDEHLKNPQYLLLSPLHLNTDESHLDIKFYNNLVNNRLLLEDFLFNRKVTNVYETNFVNAAAWFIPNETLVCIGGFDPIFHMYGEDTDYCRRIKFHNFKIGISIKSKIIHDRIVGNMVYNKPKDIYVKSIDVLKDINYSFRPLFFQVIRLYLLNVFRMIIEFKLLQSVSLIKYFIKLIFLLSLISKSRKVSRKNNIKAYLNV